ncbi:MAG TPA: protein kinase [Gemmatimonadales bacterium]|nr:protein kinase [Gemmatimonadales bacterium]
MPEIEERLRVALADRYRLERELGQGGMATVYLAEDLKHRRKVAIKVLHPELSAVIGGERFLKEIELTANLQHPHILPLFDSGAAEGLLYYVMPFVEGETLRGRLNHERQLPVEEAVRIAREVAAALDYAHKRGVVHRDIKPENVLLQDGAALVADFGIALAVTNAGAGRLTQTGLSLGTPHYMSPEQAMGEREINARSDVYALGAMTYEMLVGEPPFTGPSAQAIVAKVLTEKPVPASVHRDTVPPHVSAAIQKALAKLPADRFGTAAEFATALVTPTFRDAALGATTALPAAGAPGARRAPSSRPWIAAVAVLSLALLGAVGALVRRTPVEVPVARYAIDFLPNQAPLAEAPFALSADGSHLAYLGPSENRTQVWVKARDSWEATPLPGTDGVTNFTMSPDGKWVAFAQGTLLKKLPLTGGGAVVLADSLSSAPGLAWMDDGSIVYMRNQDRGLAAVSADGGPSRELLPRDEGGDFAFLTPLPDNRGVLFTRCPGSCTTFELMVFDMRSGRIKPVQPGGLMGWYVETGHVVYIRPDGALMAVPFDLDALEVRGAPVAVQQGVSIIDGAFPLVSLARDGTMVFRQGATGSLFGRYELVWVDRAGRESAVDPDWSFAHIFNGGNAGWALSPDGTRLAVGRNTESGDDIWVKQLPAGPALRVTFDSGAEYRPRWMPDGRSLVFGALRAGARGLYRRNADGTGADQLLLAGEIYEAAVSRDGRWLVARAGGQIGAAGARNIGSMRLGTDTALAPLLATQYDESEIALSPDGRWLAYVSDETGRPEVFLRPFPEVDDAKFQVSLNGAQAPLWSRDGTELFYLGLDRALTAVGVAPRPDPKLGERRMLFKLDRDYYPPGREYYTPFDVAPDGRFLMARRVRGREGSQAPLLLTTNWFSVLRQQLGTQ